MANTTIAIKKSATAAAVPSVLQFGELAINYADGKLFYKNVNSSIVEFSPSGGGNSFGTVNANSTLVVADTAGDILTIVPGTNISIVGDAVNDKITVGLKNDLAVTTIAATGVINGSILASTQSSGDEGGQFELALAATNNLLVGSVAIDINQSQLRIFETGGTNRGVYINLLNASTGVGTDLLAASGTTDTVARTTASAAFNKSNSANIVASSAYDKANAANIVASSAFNKANSTTYSSNVVVSVADNSNAALRITQTGTGNAFVVEDSGNPDSTPFVITSAGNVAINSTATNLAKLFVEGTIIGSESFTSRVSSGLANTARGFRQVIDGAEYLAIHHDNSNMIVEVNSAERMRIKSDGNVGIGTTTAGYKLDINGTINAASFLVNGSPITGTFDYGTAYALKSLSF